MTYNPEGLVLYFSGVPCKAHDEHQDAVDDDGDPNWEEVDKSSVGSGSHEEDESENGSFDDDDEDSMGGSNEKPQEEVPDLFVKNGAFRERLLEVLEAVRRDGIPEDDLKRTIEKYRRNFRRDLESDPHYNVGEYLIPDVVRALGDRGDGTARFGLRAGVLEALNMLENQSKEFWKDLIATWLLPNEETAGGAGGPAMIEVIAKPSTRLAGEIAETQARELAE
ncbi:hypothetical protein HK405_008055, partial [Cladochytrium tenue]